MSRNSKSHRDAKKQKIGKVCVHRKDIVKNLIRRTAKEEGVSLKKAALIVKAIAEGFSEVDKGHNQHWATNNVVNLSTGLSANGYRG